MRISDWSSDVCSSDLSCSLIEGAATAADLQPAERAMVDALRHWVAAYRRQEDALGAARTHFEQQFNAPGALWGDRRSGDDARSETLRVGKKGVSTCSSRWAPFQ